MSDEVRVLVGTIAFGLGINKATVRAVDSPVAAEIDRAVLPGGGTRRTRWPARRLRAALAKARRRPARIFRQPDHRSRRARARLAALSHRSARLRNRTLPPPTDLHALRRDAQVGALRRLRRVRHLTGVAGEGIRLRTRGSGGGWARRSRWLLARRRVRRRLCLRHCHGPGGVAGQRPGRGIARVSSRVATHDRQRAGRSRVRGIA